jgi:hypothetical protein
MVWFCDLGYMYAFTDPAKEAHFWNPSTPM